MKTATKAEKFHMAAVKELPCVVCGARPVDVHHAGTGMGGRRDHMQILPLCQEHHTGENGIHKVGRPIWRLAYGTETELLKKIEELLDANT